MSATSLRTSFAILGPSGSGRGYEHRPPREPWLMVPMGGTRALTLNVDSGHAVFINNADDQGIIRNYLGMRVCQARIVGNQLFIQGLGSGKDVPINLDHRGRQLRVMVSAKIRRTLPIIAHYVEHGPLLKTRITREVVRDIIDQANAVLFQANVRLSLARDPVLAHERIFAPDPAAKDTDPRKPAKRSLGRVVRNSEEWQLITRHRLTIPHGHAEYPPLNVFFVRAWEDIEKEGEKETHELASTDNQGNCIFEDPGGVRNPIGFGKANWGKVGGKVLAHEVGHHLLFVADINDSHHVKAPDNLMYEANTSLHANRLTRDQIETINPSNPFKPYDGKFRPL